MKRADELLWDRVAVTARHTGKKYAVLERGAWGERMQTPFKGENSVPFTGRIVDPKRPAMTGEIVPIGFYHPIFNGYIGRYGVVEVIDNLSEDNGVRYAARGRGALTWLAGAVCLDPGAQTDPCDFAEDCENYIVGIGAPAPPGSPNSFAMYDRLTRNDPIGINEVPARLSLRGYSGNRDIPDWKRVAVLFSWSPGVSAFDPTFQRCGTPGGGSNANQYPDFCQQLQDLIDAFGNEWYNVIVGQLNDGTLLPPSQYPDSFCNWIYSYAISLAIQNG